MKKASLVALCWLVSLAACVADPVKNGKNGKPGTIDITTTGTAGTGATPAGVAGSGADPTGAAGATADPTWARPAGHLGGSHGHRGRDRRSRRGGHERRGGHGRWPRARRAPPGPAPRA